MNRRQLLLCNETHIVDFSIECGWLHCFGHRLFDLTWELTFEVWVTTWPRQNMETITRRNPTDSLRLRLEGEGFLTTFYGDEFVQSLVGHAATVNLADLMRSMKAIAVGSPYEYSTPIVLSDGGTDS